MAKEPRTIDNLGVDISTRYAQDQQKLDAKIIKESRLIPRQIEIDVTSPYVPSEFEEQFLATKRNVTWADFFAPPKFSEQKKRLFSYQIIPSLGSDDKQEAQAERINARIRPLKDQEKEKKDQQRQKQDERDQKEEKMKWEEELEAKEEEKEKKIILHLLEVVHKFNRYLIDINSRRGQYHRG